MGGTRCGWFSRVMSSLFLDSSLSGLARFAEVADEAAAAPGEPGEVEDRGWRGSSEGQWGFAWVHPPGSEPERVRQNLDGVG